MLGTRRPPGEYPHVALGLKAEDLLEMYRLMLLSRGISERAWQLQRSGKTPFVVTCEGHEAAQVASVCALRRGIDFFSPYYRDLGVVVAAGMPARDVLLHLMARGADPNAGGRQLPGHYIDVRRRIIATSTVVSANVPRACGIALANRLQKNDAVVICYFGDGGTSEGDFHEGMNYAGVHKLPVVFFCENNGYAISTPVSKQAAVRDLSIRAEGYGFPGETIDGNDALAVYAAVKRAAERARSGAGPTMIEARVRRLAPHTSNDDPGRYKSRDEAAEERLTDPIPAFRKYLLSCGVLDEAQDTAIAAGVAATVDDATRYAEASPPPRPEDAAKNVYYAR